tara:strand:+ start:1788 stop:2408 length:621 start_codon:yes stop_codon:yes gene_type:complete
MSIVKLNNRGVRSVTAFGSLTSGSMVPIKKLTASSSATLSFVDGASDVVLDNTYKEYVFVFNNIHPATDSVSFQFNLSIDGGSNYNVTKTTTEFSAYHNEGDSATALGYNAVNDLAQSTNDQKLSSSNLGNGNDEAFVGTLHLFNPSSTTFVKHFISRVSFYHDSDYAIDGFIAGYGNTTSAVDAVIFKMSSGNIDAGTITLYGIN